MLMAEIGAEFYVISLQISNQDKTFAFTPGNQMQM